MGYLFQIENNFIKQKSSFLILHNEFLKLIEIKLKNKNIYF
jgi:hypothetical protein